MAGLEAAIAARALYRRCLRVQRRWPAEADRPGRNVKDALRIQARARFRAVRDMKRQHERSIRAEEGGLGEGAQRGGTLRRSWPCLYPLPSALKAALLSCALSTFNTLGALSLMSLLSTRPHRLWLRRSWPSPPFPSLFAHVALL